MIFETSRGRSALLCHSWQFKLCFVWGGGFVSTLTSSSQMGLIWHLALTTGSSSPLPGIVSRLSADCFVRGLCGCRCRQTAFETCSYRRPLHCRGGRRLAIASSWAAAYPHGQSSPCFSAQLAPSPVLHAGLPIPHAPPRPARASLLRLSGACRRFSPAIHPWRRARGK